MHHRYTYERYTSNLSSQFNRKTYLLCHRRANEFSKMVIENLDPTRAQDGAARSHDEKKRIGEMWITIFPFMCFFFFPRKPLILLTIFIFTAIISWYFIVSDIIFGFYAFFSTLFFLLFFFIYLIGQNIWKKFLGKWVFKWM